MARIGVFVCWCGRNIAGTVDVGAVAEAMRGYPGVVLAQDYTYMCSDPGQSMLRDAVAEHRLTGVVVAACSPQLHEPTFRDASAKAGLNPYLCDMANIREHCSWVHIQGQATTEKAIALTRQAVERVRHARPLQPVAIPVTRRALVVGAGVAGIQAALDIARSGYEVVVVERKDGVGGRMAQLSSTFPKLENARYLLRPRIVQLLRHPRIRVLTNSELVQLEGYVGNFKATVQRHAAPEPSGRVGGGGWRKDADHLNHEVFPAGPPAAEESFEIDVGAVVAASGYGLYPLESIPEYGAGAHPDVFTSLQFERLLRGAQGGQLRRPSDGRVPKEVVFIQCVRSRDRERGVPYCSRICCMYTAKQATLYKQLVPDGQAYVFYIDIRVHGKQHEEFVQRAIEQHGVMYLRGRVSRIFAEGDRVMVWGADTLAGCNVEIPADAVVLANAMVSRPGARDLAKRIGISCDEHGFFTEAHPKLRPVETNTAGVFLAGTCQAPRDIAGTVAHASGAASKVVELFSSDKVERAPEISFVDEGRCIGCFACREVCPYRAVGEKEIRDREGALIKRVADINRGLCQGCGVCAATCRSRCIDLDGYTEQQVHAAIGALFAGGDGGAHV